jgi:hypothetical protein
MNDTKANMTVELGSPHEHGHSVNEWLGLTPDGGKTYSTQLIVSLRPSSAQARQ